MKVCILGGSAASTPSLFQQASLKAALDAIEFTLLGRSDDHLGSVERATRLVCADPRLKLRISRMDRHEMRTALVGADVVLMQVRCGGNVARSFDETFPTRYGIPGDEGLGPGGLSAAWRTWSGIAPLLDAVADACPSALVLLLTSPVSVLVRCIRSAYPQLRIAGVCELPWTTLRCVCEAVGSDPAASSFGYAGVNHLGWFGFVRVRDRDVLSAYVGTRAVNGEFPSRRLMEKCGGIPVKYLRLHYEGRAVVAEQLAAGRARGAALEALQTFALARYRKAGRDEIERLLSLRPSPWYAHALAPLLASLARKQASAIPFFLSVPNDGLLAGFESDDVLEIAHGSEGTGLRPIADSCAISDAARADLEKFVRFERAASVAVLDRSVAGMVRALALHPWVPDVYVAENMADDIARFADQADCAASATSAR